MREPTARWEHLPVISNYQSVLPEYADWHTRQLIAAIRTVSRKHPFALRPIPAQGFHIRASRHIAPLPNGRYSHILAAGICEDVDDTLDDFDLVIVTKANNTGRKGSVAQSIKTFGSRSNAFLPILEELIADVSEGWRKYPESRLQQIKPPSNSTAF